MKMVNNILEAVKFDAKLRVYARNSQTTWPVSQGTTEEANEISDYIDEFRLRSGKHAAKYYTAVRAEYDRALKSHGF
jgi:hypothetical protein